MTNVQDKAECDIAAFSLRLEDTSAYEFQRSYIPQGCIYRSEVWLEWNPPDSSNPSVDCGATLGADTYSCICRVTGKQIF